MQHSDPCSVAERTSRFQSYLQCLRLPLQLFRIATLARIAQSAVGWMTEESSFNSRQWQVIFQSESVPQQVCLLQNE